MDKFKFHGLLLFCMLAFSGVFAQNESFMASDVFQTQTVAETALSPKADMIAFTLNVPRPVTDKPGGDYRELYFKDLKTGMIHPVLTGPVNISSIKWHPSGKTLTFRANLPGKAGVQVWQIDPKGGEPHAVTKYDGAINQYEFIDENLLLFSSTDPKSGSRQEIEQKGFDYEIFEEEFNHISLYLYDIRNNELKKITSGITVYDFAINPDKKQLAIVASEKNLTDHSYMFKKVYLMDLSSGQMKLFVDNPGKLGKIVWSPDGKKLAVQAASRIEDSVNGSLFVAEPGQGLPFDQLKNYTKGLELSVADVIWKDNETLLYVSEEYSEITVSEQKLNAPTRSIVIEAGKACFHKFELSDNILCFSANTPLHPSEVFTFDLKTKDLSRQTYHNKWLDKKNLGKQEVISYTARDGMRIEGILIYPLGYQKGKSYPLITYIHGGPEAAVQNGWSTSYSSWGQVAASKGYFVFMPNYRAGSGRGPGFTMEGYGDLLGKEYDDVIDGIDYLIQQGWVDANRVGIGGGSYGGFFSAWSATKHSERFAAAVVFVGISNQVSKRNTTDIPYEDYLVHWGFWTHEDHNKVWDASPVKYAHQSNTPTLILHGKDDPRIPYSQGMELYRALKQHGKAPVRFIIYPGEGHGNRKNTNRLDFLLRTMDWFDFYLNGKPHDGKMPELYPEYGF